MRKLVALVLVVFLLLICGCTKPSSARQRDTSDIETIEIDYSAMTENALDITIVDVLSTQELSDMLNITMEEEGRSEDGTQANYISEDHLVHATINMENMTQEIFDQRMTELPGIQEKVEELPGAIWYDNREVFCFSNGYGIEVIISFPGDYTPKNEMIAVAKRLMNGIAE